MKNTLTAFIEFYFKGEKFTPSITLELDHYMQSNSGLPNIYNLISSENNIDLYSYEYEMMLAENIKFGQAQGLVAKFVVNGELDIKAFELAWHEQTVITQLQDIAKRNMTIDDLQQHPALEAALREAYHLGQNASSD